MKILGCILLFWKFPIMLYVFSLSNEGPLFWFGYEYHDFDWLALWDEKNDVYGRHFAYVDVDSVIIGEFQSLPICAYKL